MSPVSPTHPTLSWLRLPHGGKATALNAAIVQMDMDMVNGPMGVLAPVGGVIGVEIALDLVFHLWSIHPYRRWAQGAAHPASGLGWRCWPRWSSPSPSRSCGTWAGPGVGAIF